MPRFGFLAALSGLLLLTSACNRDKYPVRTYRMGEKVTLGHLTYTVFETQWLTHLGAEESERVPQNRFFLVRASIVNGGMGEVISPNLAVEDDKGQVYQELNNGDGVPQWIGYLRKLRPADSAQGNLLFDVPPAHYKLRVLDEDNDHAALIDIPLTFNAETPEVPMPGRP